MERRKSGGTVNVKQAARAALKGTDWQALQDLLAEQTRWQRKQTIATNKLANVRLRIDGLALKLTREKVGLKDE